MHFSAFMKKILLAGPGTGKTTKIKKDFLSTVKDFRKVLVLSFTNVTIKDLLKNFTKDNIPIDERNCMTLHSYALRINHRSEMHVLSTFEEKVIAKYASFLGVEMKLLCEMLSSITYDQMITSFIEFAKTNPAYLKEKIGQIELLIVDEFQDFNEPEQALVHLISEYANDTLILGDDDQCIYDFKDATSDGIVALYNEPSIENIDHPNICYRCPDIVVEKSKNLISNNTKRVLKDWHPNNIDGEIVFEQKLNANETASWVVGEIQAIKGSSPDATILLLAPVKFAIENILEELTAAGLTHINFFGETLDFETYKKIWRLRLIYGKYKLLNLILTVECSELNDYRRGKFRKVLKRYIASSFSFGSMKAEIAEFMGADMMSKINTPPDFDQLLTTEEWSSLAPIIEKVDADTPEKKLERIDKYVNPPVVFDPTAVNIMSIHKSKGLEATHVFIVGMVDGILPRKTDGIDSLEMQRRLLFVGMTRTKKKLFLVSTVRWDGKHVHQLGRDRFTPTRAGSRCFNAQTSPFINELGL